MTTSETPEVDEVSVLIEQLGGRTIALDPGFRRESAIIDLCRSFQSRLRAAERELADLKQSILDLSHPNIKDVLRERDEAEEAMLQADEYWWSDDNRDVWRIRFRTDIERARERRGKG